MKFEIARGTRDFAPPDMVVRNHVEKRMRETFEAYGFQEIRTPLFERFELLAARSGEEIRESMFTFVSDREEYALRPEMTAPVCRFVASGALDPQPRPYKLYYVAPCFRYCRPQAGRYREFTQAGLELIGAPGPLADAEVIAVAVRTLARLGVGPCRVKLGNNGIFRSLLEREHPGDSERQSHVIHQLDHIIGVREKCEAIRGHDKVLPEDADFLRAESDALARIQQQIGYAGDAKPGPDPTRLPAAGEATYRAWWAGENTVSDRSAELLIEVSRTRGSLETVAARAKTLLAGSRAIDALVELEEVCAWLPRFGVKDFEVVLGVARGFDFYTGTIFEIEAPLFGAQKQICGGGRYDGLVADFGGPPLPATGFAFGFDRVVELFKKTGPKIGHAPVDVFVAGAREETVPAAESLRAAGVRASVDLTGLDLGDQLEYGASLGAKFSVIADRGAWLLRNLSNKSEERLPLASIAERIRKSL